MADFFTYQRKRKDFGKPAQFSDTEIKHCGYFPTQQIQYNYLERNPNFIDLDNIVEYSEHQVNTERVTTFDKGMFHKEGGWPAGVDPTEPQDTNKHKKKIEKDATFAVAVKEVCNTIEKCIDQNNQIDLFEEYFLDEESEHQVENLSTKTLMLFKDQSETSKRSVSEISWHPEGPTKAAVSYAISRFQQMPEGMNTQAYVWDLTNPNSPELQLETPSPVTNIMYNPKLVDQIGGGCYNGLITIWDVKKGNRPVMISPVEKSHHDPVTHFQWLFSKTGTECVTTSTDGRVLWWDTRKFTDGPVESLQITEMGMGENKQENIVGATVLEYNVEAPTKFLIGTEQGSIVVANRKPKKNVEITARYGLEQGRHLGPVCSINRSLPNTRYFLTVGDWSAKIWVEDIKAPIMRTKYHGSYLTDGCWSPTRNGVFFLIRKDGWMDVWDYYYRQNEIAFSHKVSDTALTCLKINTNAGGNHQAGKLVAIGDQDGTVTLLELCDSLYQLQHKEKDVINEMFEREARKEKNLEAIKKQFDQAKKLAPKENTQAKQKWEVKKQELINEVEATFNALLKKDEEERMKEEYQELDSPTQIKKKTEEQKKQTNHQQLLKRKVQAQKQKSSEQQEQKTQPQQQQEEKQEVYRCCFIYFQQQNMDQSQSQVEPGLEKPVEQTEQQEQGSTSQIQAEQQQPGEGLPEEKAASEQGKEQNQEQGNGQQEVPEQEKQEQGNEEGGQGNQDEGNKEGGNKEGEEGN